MLVGLRAAGQLPVGVQRPSAGRVVLLLQGRPCRRRQTAGRVPPGRALLLVAREPLVEVRVLVPQAPPLLVVPPRLLVALLVVLLRLPVALPLALLADAR